MLPDYHLHTTLCKHASGTPAEFRQAALSLQIPEICFTDHAPNPHGVGQDVCMATSQFPQYRQAIQALQDGKAPAVFFGVEADYYIGCEDHLRAWLPDQDFDFVLGSVHFIDNWAFDDPKELSLWQSADVTATWRKYFALLGRMAQSGLFDAVAHLDLPKKFGHRPPEQQLKEMAQPALDSIAAAGMTIEINTAGLRKPVAEIYPSPLLLTLARKRGITICFGSDAHGPEDVGYAFDSALALARNAGYREYARFRKRRPEPWPLP